MITFNLPGRGPELVDSKAPDVGDRVRIDGKLYRCDAVEVSGAATRSYDGIDRPMPVAVVTCSLVTEE